MIPNCWLILNRISHNDIFKRNVIKTRIFLLRTSDAIWRQISGSTLTQIRVNIISGNSLLQDSTRPLAEPMLTNHQPCLVAFTSGQFHKQCVRYLSQTCLLKITNLTLQPAISHRGIWVWESTCYDQQGSRHLCIRRYELVRHGTGVWNRLWFIVAKMGLNGWRKRIHGTSHGWLTGRG